MPETPIEETQELESPTLSELSAMEPGDMESALSQLDPGMLAGIAAAVANVLKGEEQDESMDEALANESPMSVMD